MKDPPSLGQFYLVKGNCREPISDERGKTLSNQMLLEKGTVIEVACFDDGSYNDTVMRIKSGRHAGKCFTTQGVRLSNPVDASKVPDLVKAIEDARKAKPKKPKSKGAIAGSLPPADAPVWVYKGDAQFRVQKVVIKDGRWALLNEPVTLYLLERVKIVTKLKDQTILQVVVPHGFEFFRVASDRLTSLFSRESAQVEFSEVAKTLLAKIWAVSEYLDSLDPNDVEQQLNKAEQFAVSKVVDQMRVRINDHVEVLDDDDEVGVGWRTELPSPIRQYAA
jgi:ribosomal protein L14E/L6E/L27E